MRTVLRVGVVACIVGCGERAGSDVDGGIASGDGGATIRGTVHVTVLDPAGTGVPAAGVPVVFADPDGTPVAVINTDGNGKAQADVLAGGSVTAVETMPQRLLVQLQTTLAVEPGDDVVIGSEPLVGYAGSFTVDWPAAPGNPAGYDVYGPCGYAGFTQSDTLSLTFSVTKECAHDTMEILVRASDTNGNAIAFNDRDAIPFVAGGLASLPDAWSSGMGFRASYINLNGVGQLNFDRRVTDGLGFLSTGYAIINGGASATFVLTVPLAATGRMHSYLSGTAGGNQVVWQTLAGDDAAYTLDGGTLLAWLTDPQPDASGQRFHLGRITAGTSSAAADLLELDVGWYRDGTAYQWRVFGPDADDVQLPALPSFLGGLDPTPADAARTTAILYEADTLAGYAAVRANIDKALGETFQDMRRSHTRLARTSASRPQDFGAGW